MAKIGELLGFGDNPFYKGFAGNRQLLSGAFAGMAANPMNPWGGFAQGAQIGGQLDTSLAEQERERLLQEEQTNATTEWLKSNYPQYSGLPPAQGWQAAMADMGRAQSGAVSMPSNVQEWQYYSSLSPEDQSRYLLMKRSNTPLNIGTGFVTQDPANPGAIMGPQIDINNRQAEYEKGYGGVEGRADAESAALAESIGSKLPGLRTVIDELTALADTATYTMSGQAMDNVKRELGLPVGQGAIDRASYIAIVDNQVLPLLRDTFGAAFTQKEGESLRATLGDPNKSPAEKKAILNAFISQKERDIAGMQNRAVGAPPAPAPAPVTSDWQDLGNGVRLRPIGQ